MKGLRTDSRRHSYLAIGLWVIIFILFNRVVADSTTRWDFTESGKHTLSDMSLRTLSEANAPIEVRAFIPQDLPPREAEIGQAIRDALSDYRAHSQVPFNIELLDPLNADLSESQRADLTEEAESYGLERRLIEAIESDRRIQQSVWFDIVFLYEDRHVVMPRVTRSLDVEYAVTRALKTVLDDGYTPPVIGFSVSHGEAPILKSPLRPKFEDMGELIGVPLDGQSIPTRVDVLVVLGPSKPLNDRALYTIDQFLVRGGSLILLLDYRRQSRQFPDLLLSTAPGLATLLTKYGIKIETDRTVVDRENPANTRVVMNPNEPATQTSHPLYVYARSAQRNHPVTAGISEVVTPLVSHIDLTEVRPLGLDAIPLLVTGENSVRRENVTQSAPDAYLRSEPGELAGPAVVGAVVQGHFQSAYATGEIPKAPEASPFTPPVRNSPHIDRTDTTGRIVLVTSGTRMLAALHNGQLLLENAVEWGGSNDALNDLRSRRAQTPRLDDMSAESRTFVRVLNLIGPCALLFMFGFILRLRRHRE